MSGIKKKDIEIKLEDIPPIPDSSPELEQYITPPEIAADILFDAYLSRDIMGRTVADLGCGTGMFSFGSYWMGASKVTGLDIEGSALDVAMEKRREYGIDEDELVFIEGQVESVDTDECRVDTVIMNPPFGAQNKGADIPFLKKAFGMAPRIYSLHNSKTEEYLRGFIEEHGFHVFREKRYMFGLDRVFSFHKEENKEIEVTLFGIEEKDY